MTVQILGIDCATKDEKVGLARATLTNGRLYISDARKSKRRESTPISILIEWIGDGSVPTLLALDAPLGWPMQMGERLREHNAGDALPVDADKFFSRETDRFIRDHHGKRPLDVGADLVGRTALAALTLLDDVAKNRPKPDRVPLLWFSTQPFTLAAIEVYPAVTLASRSVNASGYKTPSDRQAREMMLTGLAQSEAAFAEIDTGTTAAMLADADVFDAAVCALAGADMLRGTSVGPNEHGFAEIAKHEGWIWAPKGTKKAPT